MVKKVSIPLSALFTNVGQIEGLPPNPRLIKDEKFEVLKKSLTDGFRILSATYVSRWEKVTLRWVSPLSWKGNIYASLCEVLRSPGK